MFVLARIFTKCKYCGVWVNLFFSDVGFDGQGMGWYCPACLSRILPRKENLMGDDGDEED